AGAAGVGLCSVAKSRSGVKFMRRSAFFGRWAVCGRTMPLARRPGNVHVSPTFGLFLRHRRGIEPPNSSTQITRYQHHETRHPSRLPHRQSDHDRRHRVHHPDHLGQAGRYAASRHRPEIAPGLDRRPAAPARPRRPLVALQQEVLGLPQRLNPRRRDGETGGPMSVFKVGKATVTRIEETYLPIYPVTDIFPAVTEAQLAEHAHWLSPHHYDPASRKIKLSVHSWLLQLDGRKILIDGCCGNQKSRPLRPAWNTLDTPWLDRLAAAGARPDEIDLVMCTHLHHDHVGWNT